MTISGDIHFGLDLWSFIISLLAALTVYITRGYDKKLAVRLILLLCAVAFFNMFEGLYYYWKDIVLHDDGSVERLSVFMIIVIAYLITILADIYIERILIRYAGVWHKQISVAVHIICTFGIILMILSRFFGFFYGFDELNNFVYYNNYYWIKVISLVASALILCKVLLSARYMNKVDLIVLSCVIIIPMISAIVQMIIPGYNLTNTVDTVLVMQLFFAYEIHYATFMANKEKTMHEEKIKLLNEKLALTDKRMALYDRQIRPHFMFNSLTAIRALCSEEESEAADAIDDLAGFLRSSMDLLNAKGCITLEKELSTVRNYLKLEKRRFGDKVKVETDIREREYMVPAFTIQILVENSIRHGIRKKLDGRGTICLRTYLEGDNHIIEVEDDGVGFNEKEFDYDSEEHVGLSNVKKRLDLMCNGELEIKSNPGEGTKARVIIPVINGGV